MIMASKRNVKSVRFGDPGYEEILQQWAAECDDLPSEESDVSEAGNDDTEDRNFELVSDEYSGSSSDHGDDNSEDDVDDIGKSSTSDYIAPSGLVWSLEPPTKNKIQPHNIIRRAPGLARKHMAATPKEAFQLFVTPVIVQEIVNCTNLEGKRVYGAKGKPWKDVTVDEFLAFCGLLIHAGVDRSWDVPARELFCDEFANCVYRATMSIFRFEEIRRFVRFDDKRTRNARLETDKLAMVSYIWDLFIQQCKTCVIPDTNVTIDEQLVGFRGRCSFVQYMPSKPAKYGLKIFWMCESTSGYALDGLVYVGRQPGEPPHKNLGFEVVQTLVRSIHNSGLNLTIDNFFTSVPLATYLLDKNITVVGTLRQNKRDIPKEMKASKDRVVYTSLFCFQNNVSMVSYARKKNKCVILLSTMHHDASINDDAKRKPEIISHYNKTKGGVDIMDQMVSTYTCKRQSKRWPMTFFFNIIDVAALNAYIVFTKEHPNYNIGVTHKRRIFLKDLAKELVIPHMQRRSTNPNLRRSVRECMSRFIDICGPPAAHTSATIKRKRCSVCPSSIDRKSTMICITCKNNICNEHSVRMCTKCYSNP